MKFSKTYDGNIRISFGNQSKTSRRLYGDLGKRYSIEINSFWTKFRIHYNHMLGTKHCYTLQYQWLGRNMHKVYNWLFSTLSPKKYKVKKHIDKWVDEQGMCNSCHEYTSVLNPCCGSSVSFEGGSEYWETLLNEVCECDSEGHCYACKYYEKVA